MSFHKKIKSTSQQVNHLKKEPWNNLFLKWMFPLILPGLFWYVALLLRSSAMQLRCESKPESCTSSSVFLLDRFSISLNIPNTDEISFLAQNLMGLISLSILLLWGAITLKHSKPHTRKSTSIRTLRSSWIWLQVVLWNGFLTEFSRLIFQRPRPFVYSDPIALGANPAHYTSFFSGHTSFATASGIISILLFSNYHPPRWIRDTYIFLVATLIITTATCRILSGRHFLTDVLAAMIAGSTVAVFFYRLHRLELLEVKL